MDRDAPSEQPTDDAHAAAHGVEAELRRSQAFLDSIIENLPNMVFVKDATDLRFVRFNRAGEDLVGYSRDEMLGRNDRDLFPAGEAEAFISKDREVLASGRMTEIPTEPIQTRHQGQRILHTKKIPILGEDGSPEYLLGISEDVTERVRIDEELRDRQQTLDAVFEASPDAIMILSPDMVIQRVSSALEHIDGVPAEQRASTVALSYVHPDDQEAVGQSLQRLFSTTTTTVEARYRFRHADGHWVPVEARGRTLLDADGAPSGAVVVIRDISERVLAEEALLAARHEAEEANRAKNDFLSRMSHELRTPLNAVLGFAQLLEMDLHDEEDLESVRHILRGGRHLLELINEVLDISRIEAGTLTISLEPVELSAVVQECVDLIAPQAAERRIEVRSRAIPRRHVQADRHRLSQVFLNLLSNAIKFNHDGGHIDIDGEEHDDFARVRIADTGAGIAPEMIERLFTPFDRLGAETRGIEGTGLGLVVSKRLCEAMGITLGIESTAGEGSTFWLDVPLGEDALHVGPVAEDDPPEGDAGYGTVLHIEDNHANLRLVEQLLRHRPGMRLIDAMQGSLGLELAVQHQPDVILLDVHLPDVSGDVVLQRLKADPRTAAIPVVVVSADATSGQMERFKSAGAHDYLTKPLDVSRLLEVIDGLSRPAAS